MTVELLLGPCVDKDAIDLVLGLERRGYDVSLSNGQPVVRPSTGLTSREVERLRRHRGDIVEIVQYCATPPLRPWN